MATTTAVPPRAVLAESIRSATRAPSLHNSQPWRFRIGRGRVDVYADLGRQLAVADPGGRELMMSVGAAAYTLRLALLYHGYPSSAELFPEPGDPDLVVRVTTGEPAAASHETVALAAVIGCRHTNRWPFAPCAVPGRATERLRSAARREGACLSVADPARTLAEARRADEELRGRPDYWREVLSWVTTRESRSDGVPVCALGPGDLRGTIPVRGFARALPVPLPLRAFEAEPTVLVLSTAGDTVFDHLTAGRALQRVMLTATLLGLAMMPISQPVEVGAVRARLAGGGAAQWPQMVLRVGYGRPVPAVPRRPLEEILLPAGGRKPSEPPRRARPRRHPGGKGP